MKKFFTTFFALLVVIVNSVFAQDSWSPKSNFLGVRQGRLSGFTIGTKGYICTGRGWEFKEDFWEYDQAADVWTQKASYSGPPSDVSLGFSIGNKGYLGVSITHSRQFNEYDPAFNTWKSKSTYPGNANESVGGFSIGNKGYVGTGFSWRRPIEEQWTKDFWEYDPAMDTWTRKTDFAGAPRGAATGFSIGNIGYLGLGLTSDGYSRDFWAYDPATDSWEKKADFPGHVDNRIGFSTDKNGYAGTGSKDDFWEYDPTTDAWTQKRGLDFSVDHVYFAMGIGSKGYLLIDSSIANNNRNFWEYSPGMRCLASQVFCYSNTNNYSVPPLVVNDVSGIESITYSITGATNRNGAGNNASGLFNPGISIITWKVTNNAGNASTCQNNVRVDQPLTATIADAHPLLSLGHPNTLYIGFGPTDLTLTAMPSGGTKLSDGTYSYAWSNAVTSNSISIHASAAGSYNYSVTITDSLGCQSTVAKTINMVDVRCGNNMDKVIVCGPYRFRNIKSCVNENQALLALLFGARLGSCDNAPQRSIEPNTTDAETGISIFPNPNNGSFVIQLTRMNNVEVRVRDQSGRIISRQNVNSSNKVQRVTMNLGKLINGLYSVEAVSKEGVYITKMLVQK